MKHPHLLLKHHYSWKCSTFESYLFLSSATKAWHLESRDNGMLHLNSTSTIYKQVAQNSLSAQIPKGFSEIAYLLTSSWTSSRKDWLQFLFLCEIYLFFSPSISRSLISRLFLIHEILMSKYFLIFLLFEGSTALTLSN